MQDQQIRVFVSGKLMRAAESSMKPKSRGRPINHSTCLILAMMGVKEMTGKGYRETCSMFADSGYTKLPDFRTLQWRSARLTRELGVAVTVKRQGGECSLLLERCTRAGIVIRNSCSAAFSSALRRLKKDFAEIAI